ncbi:MAG TPA: histidine kinase dimerization/phospho-acceptor domain-containing protein, partial [bacterium]|nr:histidine kinase dimerization/phospho-acceptor domain-containing protein [bacterium]
MTVLRNLYRQFPEKNGSPASFSRIEKILQNQLGLTKVVFALRYDKALKTIDGKNPFSAPLQKKVFVHFNQTLKPWILQKNDDLGWLGFWPVTTSKHWVGCFAMGRKRHPGELSGEEKILIELLADRTAFYLDKGRLWEILEKADRQSSLGFMSAAMIHEMRCPLTVLSTLVQLMAEKKDTRFISSIQPLMLQQINRLSGMTDHFLSFTHLEPKKTTRIEFSQVMNQVVRLLRPLFEVKRVQLKVKSSSGLFLKGNEPQLESLLLNLLQNALESSRPQGKIEISTALIFRR